MMAAFGLTACTLYVHCINQLLLIYLLTLLPPRVSPMLYINWCPCIEVSIARAVLRDDGFKFERLSLSMFSTLTENLKKYAIREKRLHLTYSDSSNFKTCSPRIEIPDVSATFV